MGMCRRSSPKPECISALMERATRRAAMSAGHSCFSGYRSATVSQMASESHTGSSLIHSTGTLPVGDQGPTPATFPSSVNLSCTSANGMPACLSSTQGRIDQDE
jgi:hypothetical protein